MDKCDMCELRGEWPGSCAGHRKKCRKCEYCAECNSRAYRASMGCLDGDGWGNDLDRSEKADIYMFEIEQEAVRAMDKTNAEERRYQANENRIRLAEQSARDASQREAALRRELRDEQERLFAAQEALKIKGLDVEMVKLMLLVEKNERERAHDADIDTDANKLVTPSDERKVEI